MSEMCVLLGPYVCCVFSTPGVWSDDFYLSLIDKNFRDFISTGILQIEFLPWKSCRVS
jgi:hypothetical protein